MPRAQGTVSKKEVFSTAADNQPAVNVHVLQGERELAKDNRSLGRFNLEGIAPAPRGMPQIEVAFDIDADGIVHVSAKDMATGKAQKIRIESASGLSESEIEDRVRDAAQHAEEDSARRKDVEMKNEGEHLVYTTEKALEEHRAQLSETTIAEVEERLMALKEALKSENGLTIEAAIRALNEVAQKMGSEMYAQSADGSKEPVGAGVGAGASGGGADYVDADYTVVDD